MRDELLALLEDGGHSSGALAEWLGADRLTVIRALKALEQQGLVAKTEQGGTGVVWRLTGVPPAPAPRAARKPGRPKKVLRQPDERPPSQALPKETAPSWWVGLTRDQLRQAVDQQQGRMAASKAAKPTPRELGYGGGDV